MMTGIARIIFPEKSGGNLIYVNNKIIGSKLIGQSFTGAKYFHGRPSANNYDASSSGGSNYGPTNREFINQVTESAEHLRKENGLAPSTIIPADTVLASGSGLDPHISLESAKLQAKRIANERKINESIIIDLVNSKAEKQYFGIAGNSFVNVLKLNMTMDSTDIKK
jgi:K+-transporting ATPase ATPase C chain